jgi:hypothetical protein
VVEREQAERHLVTDQVHQRSSVIHQTIAHFTHAQTFPKPVAPNSARNLTTRPPEAFYK